jgi:YYY domain-containing protein
VTWFEAAARWYGILVLLTWAFAPGARWLCAALMDRGATITRPVALLAAIYPAWLLASAGLAPFSRGLIVAAILIAAVAGWGFTFRRDGVDRAWLRSLLAVEVASLALFAAYVWLRGYTPQILGTEKPMDVAFLASSARTTVMPPPDPWFAGEPINYYYLGYLLHGAVARLSGVPAATGFNLALATIFSMTAVAAFGIAWNVLAPSLGRRAGLAGGLLAAFFVAFAGNLYAPWRLLQDPATTLSAWWWDSAVGIGWRSSRIVCDGPRTGNLCAFPSAETINEFPFFSFLLGDLHPHLMALPYTVVALTLAWNLARLRHAPDAVDQRGWLVRVALSGAVIGALYPLNAWDFPTFLLVAAIAVLAASALSLHQAWRPLLLLGAVSVLAWLPFWLTYVPPTRPDPASLPPLLARLPVLPSLTAAVGIYAGEHTSIVEYLTIFGVPYVFGLGLLVAGEREASDLGGSRELRALLIGAVAAIIPGVILSAPVIPLCGIPLALALAQLRRMNCVSPRTAALALFAVAWALSIGVELVYIQDIFHNRMNTLFKFYYQTWTLSALAAAITIGILWAIARLAWQRAALFAAVAVALVASAAYPAVASYQWTEHFTAWRGLDGLAYGEATAPGDVAAIRWLAAHAAPGDVILEAAGCSYLPFEGLPFDRVSAFTGVPTVIGWDNHERQWRAGQPALIDAIVQRQTDVAAMYADPGSPLIADYGVDWLVVGAYETGDWRATCQTAGPYPGIDAPGYPGPGWDEVFQSGETRIYQRAQP